VLAVVKLKSCEVPAELTRFFTEGIGGWHYSKKKQLRWQEDETGQCVNLQVFDDESSVYMAPYYRPVFNVESTTAKLIGKMHNI
jgi:hypothetical protein